MSFLIGGFSQQQYKSYLIPASIDSENCKSNHWVDHFNFARYPTLTLLMNRIAYFILHHFSEYPNNAYLFQKFKSHDFALIDEEEELEIAKNIFTYFQNCSELNETELKHIEDNLNSIERHLLGQVDDLANKVKRPKAREVNNFYDEKKGDQTDKDALAQTKWKRQKEEEAAKSVHSIFRIEEKSASNLDIHQGEVHDKEDIFDPDDDLYKRTDEAGKDSKKKAGLKNMFLTAMRKFFLKMKHLQ